MRVVVVSQSVEFLPDRAEWRDALDQRMIEFLLASGCLPVPVPNNIMLQHSGIDIFHYWIKSIAPVAVVLSGGADIGNCIHRDTTETALLAYAERKKLPALGICRGMQMMGIFAGAKLRAVVGHARTRHVLVGEIARQVNSYHNFVLATCPPQYDVIAHSSNGEVEAIRHQLLSWEGWMWHPEREEKFCAEDIRRANVLLQDSSQMPSQLTMPT